MKSIQSLTLLMLLAWCTNALATLAIRGDVVIDPHPSVLLRGQQATVTYMLTNIGDEPLELASAGFDYRTFGPLSTLLLLTHDEVELVESFRRASVRERPTIQSVVKMLATHAPPDELDTGTG